MFPIDHEFTMVYALYILLFCYIIYRLVIGGRGEKVRLICIVSISLTLNIFLYIDPVNFQGGASLGVLFYSLIIWLFTALVTAVNCIFFKLEKENLAIIVMEKDKQDYIINHYLHLMSPKEKLAYKHAHSLLKIDQNEDIDKIKRVYFKAGWLTKDKSALSLLDNGLEKFNENTARRIIRDHISEIFFNYCPNCGKLARTPTAKQCRFCYYDWH